MIHRPALAVAFALLSCRLATAGPAVIDAAQHPTLQAALDAVPTEGGLVVIPAGTFEITQPLRVTTAETRITGAGAATLILNKNEEGQPAMILRPPTLDADKKARLWRVQLADVRLTGNEKSGDGLFAEGIQEIYLEGVSIDHHGGHGIHLVQCFEDPRIADCILTYNKKSGIEIFDCHDIVVNANHFEENQDALRCVDSFNLCMNGNNIDDHLGHGVIIENTYGSVVSGNMIEECNGTAIILDRDCYGITLSSNVIAHHLQGGMDLRDASGCAVSANTFVLAHQFSVQVAAASENNTITGNNFCNSGTGGGINKRPPTGPQPMSIDEGTGIHLAEGVHGLAVSGNTFSGLSSPAVWSDGPCKSVLVQGNVARNCALKQPAGTAWIQVAGEGNLIGSNLIESPVR